MGGVGLGINVVGMLLFGSHGHAHGGEGGHAHAGEGGHAHGGEGGHAHGGENGHAHTEDDGHAHGRDGGKGHGHSHSDGGEICSNEGFSFGGDDQDHGGMAAKKLGDHQSADLPAEKVNEKRKKLRMVPILANLFKKNKSDIDVIYY